MNELSFDELKEINGGATENQKEFFELGRQFGKGTREALSTVGMLFLVMALLA